MKLYRIRKSKIDNKGRGLYATQDVKEGTKIIDYVGKIITNKEVDESKKFYNKKRPIKTSSYTQARKKIYSSSVNSWERYDKYLNPFYSKIG